jgi:hypothetical protein
MCRSTVNRALSSVVKTPAGLRILCPNPPTPIFHEQQSPHNPQSKSHPYKKCTTHHTQTSQSMARGLPLMNTSAPEHLQVSSPYARLPKRFQVLEAYVGKTSEYPLMQRPMFSEPSTPNLSLKGGPIDRKQQPGALSSKSLTSIIHFLYK